MTRKIHVEIRADPTRLIRGMERAHLYLVWLQLGYWLRARRWAA